MIARSLARSLARSPGQPLTGRVFAVPAPPPATERISNGGFSDGTGWTVGTGWAIALGNATNLLTSQNLTTTLITPTTNGLSSTLTFTIVSDPNGSQLLFRLRNSTTAAVQALYFNFPDPGTTVWGPVVINGVYDVFDVRTSSANGIVIDDLSLVC